jgi:hypothetical protein
MDFKLFLNRSSLLAAPVLSLSLLFLSNCGKECLKFHTPIMPYFVQSTKDTIHIGNTNWIEAKMPHIMKDFETGEFADYKNVDFNSYFDIQILTDTSKSIHNQPEPYFATSKFTLLKSIGDFISDGEVCRIIYLNRNDSFLLKVGFIAKNEGFYRFNLAYNPGSGAHGRQVVDMSDKKCTHKLNTLCQSINNGNSTIQRAKDRGFKVWISPQPTKLEYWIYDNRMYFFTVTK